jgi:transposase
MALFKRLNREPLGVRYGPRPPIPKKLDPFKSIVHSRIAEYPKLTGTRLLQDSRAAGYTGGVTQLRDYLKTNRPKPVPEPTEHFETERGHQGRWTSRTSGSPTRGPRAYAMPCS